MINTALVQVRVDEALKDEVTDIYNHYGLDLPTAIRIFFKKSIGREIGRASCRERV